MRTLEQQAEDNFHEWLAEQDIDTEVREIALKWIKQAFTDAYMDGYSDGENGV
jgi:hypothetical protein